MVAIQKQPARGISPRERLVVALLSLAALVTGTLFLFLVFPSESSSSPLRTNHNVKPQAIVLEPPQTNNDKFNPKDTSNNNIIRSTNNCPYQSLQDLTPLERYPSKGARHMVAPPAGGDVTLVCCTTTAGPLNIAVHSKWAPLGAKRFLDMVTRDYFSSQVPLMRCVKHFLCQFGLAGDPKLTKQFQSTLDDDPNWLPEGPKFRKNDEGVRRFAKGYLAYAGAGKRSRNNQFIVALEPNGPLAGGSPWEVPWGELVGTHSFETLDKIYTGYGEDGPSQELLHKEGASERVQEEFPLLEYITSCQVVDQELQVEE